ncbi:MAG TPA: peptide ABC transporter substrate-binding protein, partial [Saprospiraceae bacterium]|nr:peptide ABC transporter substrate-binding protein [Saprospiraceae bacterium]
SGTVMNVQSTYAPVSQVLTFPNVGTTDISVLDPALEADPNSQVAMSMIYSGLVKTDKNMQVIPDQATWQISLDRKVYTFFISSNVKFADGTPVTAQAYVYSWSRALSPSLGSSNSALFFERPIVGAEDVHDGKTQTLTGVKALNDHSLQVTLTQPTPYFLALLTRPVFLPVNPVLVERYGQKSWTQHVVGTGMGSGPFMVKSWEHNVKMVFTPNPYYYGSKPRLSAVNMYFINDPGTAFKTYRASEGNFVWNIQQGDQDAAQDMRGFERTPLLQTDAVFFNVTAKPFDNIKMRQAFAYALDRAAFVQRAFNNTVEVANTIIPAGMPGYRPADGNSIGYDQRKAKSLLRSVYPAVTDVPPVTFTYPTSLVSEKEALALQALWLENTGVKVTLLPLEPTTYQEALAHHQIQLGFVQWVADFPDPYDGLALYLRSNANKNYGQ